MLADVEAPTNTEAQKKENVLKNLGTSTFFWRDVADSEGPVIA